MARQIPLNLGAPRLAVRLPTLPETPHEYLLHKDELHKPVRILIPRWEGPDGRTEKVQLYFWGQMLGEPVPFTLPIEQEWVELTIPADRAIASRFQIHYTIIGFTGGVSDPSPQIWMIGDDTPPLLDGATMRFEKDRVTASDLSNDGGARTVMNPLPELELGSVVRWYLGANPAPTTEVHDITYRPGDSLNILIDKAHLQPLGNIAAVTTCHARFQVEDRAGNLSDFSPDTQVELDIRTRTFGRILVDGISAATRLDLTRYPNGVGCTIPDPASGTAPVNPGEQVMLEWSADGQVWKSLEQTPGSARMLLPLSEAISFAGGKIHLRYAVREGTEWHRPTQILQLDVDSIAIERMPPLRCLMVNARGELSQSALAHTPILPVVLPRYPFMHENQTFSTFVKVGSTETPLEEGTGAVMPGPEMAVGFLTQSVLDDAGLKPGSTFELTYKIHMDDRLVVQPSRKILKLELRA